MIVFDLDGTLALAYHRLHLLKNRMWNEFYRACVDDTPNYPIVDIFNTLLIAGKHVEIWTERSSLVREETKDWLSKHTEWDSDVPLIMRKSGDHRKDVYVKEEWIRYYIKYRRYIDLAFEDRTCVVNLWRKHQIPCCQVAKGDF